GSPGAGPAMASSRAALSRTLRVTACPTNMLPQPSPTSGPEGVRARVGFKPKRPQFAAGTRIEPPPSPACAAGTMPAATAAAAPPLDPPALRPTSQGFRVGPLATGSVPGDSANSGELVRPMMTSPASL